MMTYSVVSSSAVIAALLMSTGMAGAQSAIASDPVVVPCYPDELLRAFPCVAATGDVVEDEAALADIPDGLLPPKKHQKELERLQAEGLLPEGLPVTKEEKQAARKAARKAEKDAAATAEAEAEAAQAEDTAKAEARKAERQAERQAERKAQRQAERQAARQAERKATAAAAADAEPDSVATEAVTETTARASDQEFATSVNGAAAATEGDGISDTFEKALLLGLGAVTVGALLSNGDEVVSNSGDRVVVNRDGDLRVLKDDDVLLRQPGAEVQTETFADGSARTTVERDNGVRIVTVRANDGTVLRRSRVLPDGTEVLLFDDTVDSEPVDISRLGFAAEAAPDDEEALRMALANELRRDAGRSFTLEQVRLIDPVRELAPEVPVRDITFESGSAAIQPEMARRLVRLGKALSGLIERQPDTVILIEGHTDAVGDAGYNLALSDRRAETVALALTEYFDVPPENLITQGYGEANLKVATEEAEAANRRAVLRNITGLLR